MDSFRSKTPREEYFLNFDFTNDLGGASISDATVSVYKFDSDTESKTGDSITAMIDDSKQTIDGGLVYFWIQGGAVGSFVIECNITVSDGSNYELQGFQIVSELKQ
jgi:hypothetical protein